MNEKNKKVTNPTGRKGRLTLSRQKKICEAIRAGNFLSVAVKYAGVCKATVYGWINKGEAAKSGRYFEFVNALRQAESEAEMSAVISIRKRMPDDWRASRILPQTKIL